MDQLVKRVLSKLKDSIEPHFSNDPDLKAAISAIEYMVRRHTGSGVENHLTPFLKSNLGHIRVIASLSGSDCTFTMQLFNDVGPLSDAQKARLTSMLQAVICAAVWGVYEVVQHLKNGSRSTGLRIPSHLQDLRQPVYLDLGRD